MMSDYIKREDAIKWFQGMLDHDGSDYDIGVGGCIAAVKRRIPSADVAPVVRCADCKHRYITGSTTHYYVCDFMDAEYNDNGYCHHGERSE